jgi:hypothetical protein
VNSNRIVGLGKSAPKSSYTFIVKDILTAQAYPEQSAAEQLINTDDRLS